MSNATLLTANRTTHVKIVLTALVASIAVSLVGIAAHLTSADFEPFSGSRTRISWLAADAANPNHATRLSKSRPSEL
jgi:hypothetical protein